MGNCRGANQRGSGRLGQISGDTGRLAGAMAPPEVSGTDAHGSSRATKSGLHPVGVDTSRSFVGRGWLADSYCSIVKVGLTSDINSGARWLRIVEPNRLR